MTWEYSDEYYKQYTRDTWNESAPHYEPVLRNLDKFSPDLLSAAQIADDMDVLDVATGPGEPALTIATAHPSARVVGTDLAEAMIDAARKAAKTRGVENVRFEVADAEDVPFPDASFDRIVCRFGLQIFTDPDAALREMHRLLRPGGRIATTVWGPGERCPAIHVVIGPMLEHAEPDENGYLPTPYEMGGEGELVEVLRAAGFEDAREERVNHPWTFPDADAYMESALKGTPIGHSLSEEDEDVQREVLQKTRRNLEAYTAEDGSISLPAECVVVSAVKR